MSTEHSVREDIVLALGSDYDIVRELGRGGASVVYLARDRVLAWLANELEGLTLVDTNKDPKTRLQEFLQSRACELPKYEVVAIQGEPHCRTFFVECQVSLLNEKTQGQGASRRIAEQVAAASALIALGVENGHD